jgi:AAA15 family ATPase/GTPase
MLASIGTHAIAGRTALSTRYVATEIIISHHTTYIWLKQTNKQPTKQTNKHPSHFVITTPYDTDRQGVTSSLKISVQAAIHTPHTSNQYHESVLPEILSLKNHHNNRTTKWNKIQISHLTSN